MALLHFTEIIVARPLLPLAGFFIFSAFAYIVYQRKLHPLAKYPGPFLASLTDVWQVCQFLSLKQPYRLTDLHQRYGPIVRYGPDKISITDESAIPVIYQKSSRSMPKTEFYDAFGGVHPNVFGTRDESHHAIRRRHMSHSFSMASIKDMEQYLDANIKILREKIAKHAAVGEAFDLKKALHYYVVDVLFELAFSQSFGLQTSEDDSRIPPVKEHTLLGSATGAWSSFGMILKQYLPKIPSKRIAALLEGRRACIQLASHSVQRRLRQLEEVKEDDEAIKQERKDLLTSLIFARDPETGERLTQMDLETEAFGFIIAGTHTTTATTSLLFWNLLHNPPYMADCTAEVNTNLPPLEGQAAYSVAVAESALPFLRKCVRENFRISPVFSMPLARRVMAPEGATISGHHFGQGTTLAVCNHAFHHNPSVWGEDHNVFRPSRWDEPDTAERAKLLMHFGLGGRQCIGKSMALANIYKLVSTLLREFDFQLGDHDEQSKAERGQYRGVLPPLISVGVSDLDGPLMVVARKR